MTIATRNLELYEAFALDALSQCAAPITLDQLLEIADPRNREKLDRHKMDETLTALIVESFVKCDAHSQNFARYSITALGRARFSGHSPFGELHASAKAEANGTMIDEMRGKPEPIKVDGYSVGGVDMAEFLAKNRHHMAAACSSLTIHESHEPPATAALCVDEDELDDWWESLDVEQKADAFTGFSLRMYAGESHVHVCPGERIPVAGTIGDVATAPQASGNGGAA